MNISEPYEGFSKVFDRVVSPEKYDRWERWIRETWTGNGLSPRSLLDMACGTGINSARFAGEMEVFGVDSSQSMLAEAVKKRIPATFIRGNFLNFTLPKKVDAAICLDFSTNYILRQDEFAGFLDKVYESLNDGGMFIFDFKPAKAFPKKEKHVKGSDFSFDWTCSTENAPIVAVDIRIAVDGKVFNERHVERGYTADEMKRIVRSTKFDVVAICDNCELKEPADESEMIQFVLKKQA